MKTLIFFALVSFSCATFAEDTNCIVSVSAALKDGSTIKGELVTPTFAGKTLFAENLALEAQLVRSIAVSGKDGAAKVELTNGDVFALALANPNIEIASSLGKLTIPFSNVRSLALVKRKVSAGGNAGLIFHCTFDSIDAICHPAIGPDGFAGNIEIVPGRVDGAASIPRYGRAGHFKLPADFLTSEGCIEFWAKVSPTREHFGVCDPRFFRILFSGGADFVAEFSANNGGGMGGFNIRMPGLGCVSSTSWTIPHAYSEILGSKVGDWHHYAISWTTDRVDLYLDGHLFNMAHHGGKKVNEQVLSGASVLGIPSDDSDDSQSRSPYMIDELKIWNYAKTDFAL